MHKVGAFVTMNRNPSRCENMRLAASRSLAQDADQWLKEHGRLVCYQLLHKMRMKSMAQIQNLCFFCK